MTRKQALLLLKSVATAGPMTCFWPLEPHEHTQIAKVAQAGETERETLCRIARIEPNRYSIVDPGLFDLVCRILDEEYPL